ncbi:hypothetical protein RY966_003755 [Enterobacter kobei]|nr:hypothetical protein [Enterobacter kobei]
MAIFELFSKRQKKLRDGVSDVYQYTKLPNTFRVQVIHIVRDTIGEDVVCSVSRSIYQELHQVLCKEYGVFALYKDANSFFDAIFNYFLSENNYEKCLDIIELSFKAIDGYVRENEWKFRDCKQSPSEAIEELNIRFKESGIGYQFESGELVKVDSQFIHSDTVKPILQLLGKQKIYTGANDEFLSAHEHYRHQRYKECLNDCLKSFESLLKAIHKKHSWPFNDTDTAKKLINSSLAKNLIPEYLQNQFSSIRILLESGIPTIRNKEGGHGQGTEITRIPENLASYTLHLTATTLLFLARCESDYSGS